MLSKIKKHYGVYMIIMGVFGQFMFFVQAFKIFATKSAKDLSLLAFVISFVALSSWLVYGILNKDKPLIISNIVALVGAGLVLAGIVIYS